MGRIVVGVDGSDGSRRALSWAAREAELRHDTLEVVHTYERPDLAWKSFGTEDASPVPIDEVRAELTIAEQRAAQQAKQMVEGMVAELEGIQVEAHAVESRHPAETLVELSRGADMLVVGSRGLGTFKSLMMGSVSQQAVHHAECPVVVIRTGSGTRES